MALGAMLAANAALGAVQYGVSKYKAKKDEARRPKYEIPAEVNQGLDEAKRQALVGLPEEQLQRAVENIRAGQSYSLGQNRSRKGGLTNVAALNQQAIQGYSNLGVSDAQARMANQQNVYGQLQNVANYKDQQFQLNKINPYYEGMARDQSNRGALAQNLSNTLQLGAMNSVMNPSQGQAPQSAPMNYGSQPVQYGMNPYQVQMDPNQMQGFTPSTPNPFQEQQQLNINKGSYGI